MADLEALFRTVDELTPDELDTLRKYIEHRRRVTWWVVSPENLSGMDEIMRPVQKEAEHMTEDEINAAIDAAITEVRNARRRD